METGGNEILEKRVVIVSVEGEVKEKLKQKLRIRRMRILIRDKNIAWIVIKCLTFGG